MPVCTPRLDGGLEGRVLEQVEHFNGARYWSSLASLRAILLGRRRSRLGPRDKEVDLEGGRQAMDEREMVELFKIGGRR